MGICNLAVYTTVYPGVEEFLDQWYMTLKQQSDMNFDLWIGVDGLLLDDVQGIIGEELPVNWIVASSGATPAEVRQQAISEMLSDYEAVVFVDSDDLLLPTRVVAARNALMQDEVNGCALALVDGDGNDLNVLFRPRDAVTAVANLPRTNVFGLSNSAYRVEVLKRCLPIPSECVLVDWFLASLAWGMGASIDFDIVPHMKYRQHGQNIAGFLPPFTSQRILRAAEMVLVHYNCVLSRSTDLFTDRCCEIQEAAERVKVFFEAIQVDSILTRYVDALNKMKIETVWWAFVAHPELEWIWKS